MTSILNGADRDAFLGNDFDQFGFSAAVIAETIDKMQKLCRNDLCVHGSPRAQVHTGDDTELK